MKNEQTFRNFLQALDLRAETVSLSSQMGLEANYGYQCGYLQSLVYQLARVYPEVEKALEQEVLTLNALNRLEGVLPYGN